MNKTKEPFAIVTDSDKVITNDVYKNYVIDGETEPTSQIHDDLFHEVYGEKNLVKPLYDPDKLASLLEINTYHSRCVKTKAQDTAGNGYRIKKMSEDADESERETLEKFFDSQHPPVEDILTRAEIDYNAIGYNFIELVKTGNLHNTVYRHFNHAPAHTIRVIRDKIGGEPRKFVQKRGGKYVYFKSPLLDMDVHKKTGREYEEGELNKEDRANDMIMMKEYTPRSDYYGIAGVVNALGAIWGNLAQQSYNNEFFKNHGVPQYAVYITGNYDLDEGEDGKPKVVTAIEESLANVRKNPHSSLVFGIPAQNMGDNVEVTFEPLAIETKDASFRMFRKDNRDEVIIAHAMPANRIGVGDSQNLGGDNAYETNRIYKESVLNPRQKEIEDYINKYIVEMSFGITDWKFKLNSIDVDSVEKDIKVLEFLFENGSATPNDLIRNLGEDYGIEVQDKEELDDYYIKGQPISKLHEEQTNPIMRASQKEFDKVRDIMKNKLLGKE